VISTRLIHLSNRQFITDAKHTYTKTVYKCSHSNTLSSFTEVEIFNYCNFMSFIISVDCIMWHILAPSRWWKSCKKLHYCIFSLTFSTCFHALSFASLFLNAYFLIQDCPHEHLNIKHFTKYVTLRDAAFSIPSFKSIIKKSLQTLLKKIIKKNKKIKKSVRDNENCKFTFFLLLNCRTRILWRKFSFAAHERVTTRKFD
jgi:hypothetical protein